MRVIQLACVSPPEIGGIGEVAWSEVQGLRAMGVEAELPRLGSWFKVGNAAWVRGWSEALRGADIIHLHYPWYGVAERLLFRRSATPIVVTFHMDATAADWRGPIFEWHRRLLQPRLLRHADKIIVSSRDYAEHSSLRHQLRELEDKLVDIPFGLDTDFFSPSLDTPASPLTSSRGGRYSMLFVGGLDLAHSFKGLEVLLEALAKMDGDTRLVIVGDGDRRQYFEGLVDAMGLRSRVEFRGRVDRGALREAYCAADVLALPSTSAAEAFGLVAAEAQACGVPVVASCLPGVRQAVLDGVTGRLVAPGSATALLEALEKLRQDPALRQSYARAARLHVLDHFDHRRHLEEIRAVYQSLC